MIGAYIGVFLGWVLLLAGFLGLRHQLTSFAPAFTMLLAGTLLALTSGLVCLWWVFRADDGRLYGMSAVLVGLLPCAIMVTSVGSKFTLPAIHDVATAPGEIEFVLAPELRSEQENKLSQPTIKEVELQRQAYPELSPLLVAQTLERTYLAALDVAQTLGWVVTYQEPDIHFEAYSRTPLLHFTDDIVVQLTPENDNVRVDVRSASRVGKGDLGANAQRIDTFLQCLAKAVKTAG